MLHGQEFTEKIRKYADGCKIRQDHLDRKGRRDLLECLRMAVHRFYKLRQEQVCQDTGSRVFSRKRQENRSLFFSGCFQMKGVLPSFIRKFAEHILKRD